MEKYISKAIGVQNVPPTPEITPGFTVVGHRFFELANNPSTAENNVFSEREDIDGATLRLEPGSSTRVLEVAKGWTFTDVIAKGSGWFISEDRKGNVRVRRLMEGKSLEPIVYTEGMVTAYIAGKKGMEIDEITAPRYADSAEIEVSETDAVGASLNPDFWKSYKMLLKLESVSAEQKRIMRILALARDLSGKEPSASSWNKHDYIVTGLGDHISDISVLTLTQRGQEKNPNSDLAIIKIFRETEVGLLRNEYSISEQLDGSLEIHGFKTVTTREEMERRKEMGKSPEVQTEEGSKKFLNEVFQQVRNLRKERDFERTIGYSQISGQETQEVMTILAKLKAKQGLNSSMY